MTSSSSPRLPTSHGTGPRLSLSVIVPVRNEAPLIEGFLAHVRERVGGAELLVVDGESSDGTASLAARQATVLASLPGRARQMNWGAAAAAGDVLWFVHADSWLPEGATAAIEAALSDPRVAGGCFRLEIPRAGLVYRLNDRVGNWGVDRFGIACGDHALFVRREVFEAIGGYPDVPILEDVELYRRARQWGRMRQLRLAVRTSPRRWERNGAWRTTAIYAAILGLYRMGVSIERLDRLYRRLR